MIDVATANLIKDLAAIIVPVGSAVWVVLTYLRDQKKAREDRLAQSERDNKARAFEARKPFHDRQLALYGDVAKVIGRLATTADRSSPEWGEDVRRFYQLFWAELSMVEDEVVKKAMESFSDKLQTIIESRSEPRLSEHDIEKLQKATYRLASALRASIASSWDMQLASFSERSAS